MELRKGIPKVTAFASHWQLILRLFVWFLTFYVKVEGVDHPIFRIVELTHFLYFLSALPATLLQRHQRRPCALISDSRNIETRLVEARLFLQGPLYSLRTGLTDWDGLEIHWKCSLRVAIILIFKLELERIGESETLTVRCLVELVDFVSLPHFVHSLLKSSFVHVAGNVGETAFGRPGTHVSHREGSLNPSGLGELGLGGWLGFRTGFFL